jgi:hypothetical protein
MSANGTSRKCARREGRPLTPPKRTLAGHSRGVFMSSRPNKAHFGSRSEIGPQKSTETRLVAQAAVEAFQEGVLLALAQRDVVPFDLGLLRPVAAGADLLITDQECQKAWSVQVKTNRKPASFWLLSKHALSLKSASHVYVFVNIRKENRPEYIVAPSEHVATKVVKFTSRKGSIWYSFSKADRLFEGEGWEMFGDPHLVAVECENLSQGVASADELPR